MQRLKQIKLLSVMVSFFAIVFGIVLIFWPEATKIGICYTAGSVLMLVGVITMLDYFIYGFEPFGLLKGVIDLVIGIIIVCSASLIASPKVFSFIFGVIFIVRNIFRAQDSLDYRKMGIKTWFINLMCAILMVAFGIVLLIDPFGSEHALLVFLGVSIAVESIINILIILIVSSKAQKIKKSVKQFFAPIQATYVVKDGNSIEETKKEEIDKN